MTFNRMALFLLIFFIQSSLTQVPPVVPLTNALTAVYCHSSDDPGIMTIRCRPNEKIRMLDAFDAAVGNRSHLPIQCLTEKQISKTKNTMDCKVQTSFTSACSGRENCTLHMQRIRLNSPDENCQNELVDYTMAFFECISDVFIHDVCSTQAITSAWGTLQTPNFPNPYTSSDDCWCKLSTQVQHRLLLSIIVFQLIPYEQHCAGAGLYLQSSNAQRSTQCTYLQQGHNYLSDTNALYINFYSRTPTVRGGFWLIYEASHPNAEVHLHCGSRDKIGVPTVSNSISPPTVSTSYDHGWSRLAFNNPPNPTTPSNNHMIRMALTVTTPRSSININSKINTSKAAAGAFTYPYGTLTTFELAYGPKGWYVKQPAELSNRTLPTTPIAKWNFTWFYTRPPRTKVSMTTSTSKTTTESTTTTTTKQTTTTSVPTTTTRIATPHQRLLFTHKPWIYNNFNSSQLSTTHATTKKSILSSSALSSIIKITVQFPTPWYPPDRPFTWWPWPWHTTKIKTAIPIIPPTTLLSTTPKTTTTSPPRTITTTRWIPATITTTKITTRSSEKTTTMTTQHTPSVQRITWSSKQPISNQKEPLNPIGETYDDGLDYPITHGIQRTITSTIKTSTSVSVSPRQRYQPIGFLPTNSNWKIVTINTPPVKRYHLQQNSGLNERNAGGDPNNEQVTSPNVHNMIRRVMEQRHKKNSMDYGWLSKTDMTIVAVSVLFVILLAIINLILFAVRRHRHRTQGRHLLSSSIPSLLDERKLGGTGLPFHDMTNTLSHTTNNNNNNDILPAVGEIVIWDEKDQGGYMIDNNGAWAKIEGRQWFGGNLFKSCTKTSLSKSFRSRFRFMRHLDKKTNQQQQTPITPKAHHIQQQTFKFPLLMDTATLSPVPEGDDYDSSDLSLSDVIIRSSATTTNYPSRQQQKQPLIKSERKHDFLPQYQQNTTKVIQALIHTDAQQSDEYYKRIGTSGDESNYTSMPENGARDFSIGDQETDRSLGNEIDGGGPVVVCVPTLIKQDDTNTDGGESIYNPHYSIQTLDEYSRPNYLQPNNNTGPFSIKPSISTFKPMMNNSVIVGFCQGEFQSLDPKLLFKSIPEHHEFHRSSQTVPISTHDSGFIDDQTVGSFTATNALSGSENNLITDEKDEDMSMDDILLAKSEDDDEDNLPLNSLAKTQLRNSNQQKWRQSSKRVSFQEEHVTQRFSPPPSSFNTLTNPDTESNPFDTYDVSTDMIQIVPTAPSLLKSFLPPSTISSYNENSPSISSLFTVQKPIKSIDNENDTDNVIMNHLHSVKSLKKFFETKMVVQGPVTSSQTALSSYAPSIAIFDNQRSNRSSLIKEQTPSDDFEQRQEMMDKILGSLKKKRVYSRTTNDTSEPNGRYSAMTTSSYDSTLTQNLPVQRHYSRRFRSSSTSNNSLHPGGNIITHINLPNSHHNKRAYSQDRQYYQTTDHHLINIDKWKQEQQQQQRQIESDDDDNISENSMLWQARTKLNQFVTRTRKNQQQSSYYATCTNGGTPSEDLYTYDDNESVTAETRF